MTYSDRTYEERLSGLAVGNGVLYRMAVWSHLSRRYIMWESRNNPDPTGVYFPGPGVFGVDTQPWAHIEACEVIQGEKT